MENDSITKIINMRNRDNGRKFLKYFEQITKNPKEVSTKLLFKILDDNKDTEYGKNIILRIFIPLRIIKRWFR